MFDNRFVYHSNCIHACCPYADTPPISRGTSLDGHEVTCSIIDLGVRPRTEQVHVCILHAHTARMEGVVNSMATRRTFEYRLKLYLRL